MSYLHDSGEISSQLFTLINPPNKKLDHPRGQVWSAAGNGIEKKKDWLSIWEVYWVKKKIFKMKTFGLQTSARAFFFFF